MPTPDVLRLTLPSAFLLANGTQISAKQYDLILYAREHYPRVDIVDCRYTPAMAKVQILTYAGGIEMGQYTGSDGTIPLNISLTPFEETRLSLFNLSIETDVALTFRLTGWSIGEVPS